jgi:hypothetical protein
LPGRRRPRELEQFTARGQQDDALHRTLKARATRAGMSLSEIAERPTLAELRERLHQRKPVAAQIDTARLVSEERESR